MTLSAIETLGDASRLSTLLLTYFPRATAPIYRRPTPSRSGSCLVTQALSPRNYRTGRSFGPSNRS